MQIGCNNVQVITIWENSSHASAGNERMSGLTLSTDNSMNPILLISLNLFKECFIFQQCNETVKCWLETAHYTWTCKVPAHHASRPNKMLTLYVSAKQRYNLSLVAAVWKLTVAILCTLVYQRFSNSTELVLLKHIFQVYIKCQVCQDNFGTFSGRVCGKKTGKCLNLIGS